MWILPKNISDTCPSVADTRGLGLDSEEFSQMCEKSLMLKSKPSLWRTWLRRWKRIKFIQHLCSRTLKNSHSESFVDAWTSCQEGSLANLSPQQERREGRKTQDTSSPTYSKASNSADQQLCFSKMLRESSAVKQPMENLFSSMSSKVWKQWVIGQRQEFSQRLKSELHTRENECSLWGTPSTMDTLPPRSAEALARAKKKGGCKNLREEVANWPTPTIAEVSGGMRLKQIQEGKWGNIQLREAIAMQNWPTPTTSDHKGSGPTVIRKDGKDRSNGRLDYATETHSGQPVRTNSSTTGKNLEQWGTPSASDHKGHPGKNSKQKRITKQVSNPNRLNPSWVEQLMGLEVGWTQLPTEWTD